MCLIFVFFGFVGYFSRVNLNAEFQKADQNQNIDYVFMMVDQIPRDEQQLKSLREKRNTIAANSQAARTTTQAAALSSDEFREYFDAVLRIQSFLDDNRDNITAEYGRNLNQLRLEDPDLEVMARLSSQPYPPTAPDEAKKKIDDFLGKNIRELKVKMVNFAVKHRSNLRQVDDTEKSNLAEIDSGIRAILSRHPHLGFADELARYGIDPLDDEERRKRSMIQQTAILKSYDDALRGLGGSFLRLPTIVSTLVVTLATGLLGGLVSFMGAAIATRRKLPESDNSLNEPQLVSLVRRAILGVTAALGIFLFFGSGLLVLTAQGGKALGAGSLELSPYFVAFLAFISGFLADDAFARLREAGQGIFQTGKIRQEKPNAVSTEGGAAPQPTPGT
jgi:hypothetical protein